MNLAQVVHMSRDKTVEVGRLYARLVRAQQNAPWHIDTLLLQERYRKEKRELEDLLEKRSWLLVQGVKAGEWSMCEARHEAYSETPEADGWLQDGMLGATFWFCSQQCIAKWRTQKLMDLEKPSIPVELTFKSGRKAILKTTGKTLHGHRLSEASKA